MRLCWSVSLCLTVASVFSVRSDAQTPQKFDVVSIKRADPNAQGGSIGMQPGNRFVMRNMEIRSLIGAGYPADTPEYVGLPSWAVAERYDLTAQAPAGVPRSEMQPMFQALLADRFKFKGHYETREEPMWALVLARADGRLGPAMKKIDVDCAALAAARQRGDKGPELAPGPTGMPPCSMRAESAVGIVSAGMSMPRLARSIQGGTGRVIVDKTGLTGDYEFTLNYTSRPDIDSDRPTIFTALQEQLGLKLESIRGEVRVLVIDHIERPTED